MEFKNTANNYQKSSFTDRNLQELIDLIWERKLLIILTTGFFAITSLVYALSIPNIYTSSTLVSPSVENSSLSSKLSNYSSLAGIAGVDLPAVQSTKSQEAIARIQSLDFFSNHISPYIKAEDLIAVKKWHPRSNKIEYDDKIYNEKLDKWVRKFSYPKKLIPSNQELYLIYKRILTVSVDKKTNFATISIDHQSPYIAQNIAQLIVTNININMSLEDKEYARKTIDFLNDYSSNTNLQSLNEAIYSLLDTQIQTLMLASTNVDYVFKYLNRPVVPERKSKPSRAIICTLGTFIGFIISIFIVLLQSQYKKLD